MLQKRTAFYVSDRTGITAEMLGHSLLTQFEGVVFTETPVPFVDSLEKAQELLRRIDDARDTDGKRPLVFTTLVDPEISAVVASADALVLDCFEIFIAPLEAELGIKSSHTVGRSHSAADVVDYHRRIEAVNYALAHDDGVSTRDLTEADVILVGVSRSGKTPTCLYLALQFGVRAANYPLVPEDFSSMRLPSQLRSFRAKLFGLTINADRLQHIRSERKPGSSYATLPNCQFEVREAEALMRQEGIPYLDTTTKSIEEIATHVLHEAKLVRHIY
ncbi:MAG: kinase/pyrophosphorylase [Betaproteobacteria bacterium]|nr:kinase/pyrophosphorylase [Betaproteobacteria bacterium]